MNQTAYDGAARRPQGASSTPIPASRRLAPSARRWTRATCAASRSRPDLGNNIITLDEAETARWKEAAQATVDQWLADMSAKGVDGKALYDSATAMVEKNTK